MGEVKSSDKVSFRSGLTTRSVLAAIYAVVVFTPAIMYLQLVTGQSGFSVAWFTLLLWVKLVELSGRKMTKQEALIIYLLSGLEFLPIFLVYRAWYRQSEVVRLLGFISQIPDWYAPPPNVRILEIRTLIHPSWASPISIFLIYSTLNQLLAFSLALFARETLIETENLPFPVQQAGASAVITVSEGESTPRRVLSVFAAAGFVYGFFLYALPFVIQSWTGRIIQIIPIPWVDLNKQIEPSMPGASFGIATDIIPYATGIVLPFRAAMSLAIGSLAVYFFGNWLVVKYGLSPTSWWTPGMTISLAANQSILYFWATILIGFALAAGVAPILRHPGSLALAVKHLVKPFGKDTGRRTDPVSFTKFIIIPLVVSLIGGIALFILLVPDFILSNPWFILFMVFLPFVSTLTAGRMIGEAGTATFPSEYLQNIAYLTSGYPKVDVWFVPSLATTSGHGYLAWFKVAQLTETRIDSLIKAFFIVWPISLILGLYYLQVLWTIAPIPSARYPGTEIYWPISATYQSLWIRGREAGMFPVTWIFFAFVAGTAMFFVQDLLKIPISFAALAAGCGTLPPYGIAYMVGGIFSLIVEKTVGKEWWRKNKLLGAAGLMMGESIAITISVGVSLIINSIWIQPY